MRRVCSRILSIALAACVVALAGGCDRFEGADGPQLSKPRGAPLELGERYPQASERDASGPIAHPVARGTAAFTRLVRCDDRRIAFKDEEHTGADRMMTIGLRARVVRLAGLVADRWPGVNLRVTEAWDEDHEHGEGSLHYEGRAADLTTSDVDPRKLGELGHLAIEAGFDWVFYEDASHVHASVRREKAAVGGATAAAR